MKWLEQKRIAERLFVKKRKANFKWWIRICCGLLLLSLLAGLWRAADVGEWQWFVCFLPAAALALVLLLADILQPALHEPDAHWRAVLRHLSISYAVTVLHPRSSALSDFHIVECSPHFPDWFAIDRKRMPGMTENGFIVYNQRMHGVLHSKESAAFCACDRLGNSYDMEALYIGKNRVLLLSRTADPQGCFVEGGEEAEARDRIETLQKSNHELEALSYSISHEIKAPVRTIDGYARLFLEDYGVGMDREALLMIGNIRNICGETIVLINKLLEYTKISAEKPKREVVDLETMLQDVFQELRVCYGRESNARFQLDTRLPPVIGDSFLIRQAMSNILSNALKFTREKPVAIIRAGCSLQNGKPVFYVRDNGAGFDMQFSQKLFGLFQRMHTPEEFEGSGIGLATVKKVIQEHGGTAWMTGEVGRGATIYFTFARENVLYP